MSHWGLNNPIKTGEQTIHLDFVQVDESGCDAGIKSVALDQMGPYTIARDLIFFQQHNKREIVPRLGSIFESQVKEIQQQEQQTSNPSIT